MPAGSILPSLPFVGAIAVGLLFYRTRYENFSPLLSATLRASAAGLLVFLVFAPPEFTLANPEKAAELNYINNFYYPVLLFAVVSLFRPAFVTGVAIYVISGRYLVQGISSLWMSTLDITYMIDMALFLSIFSIFVAHVGPRLHPRLSVDARQDEMVGIAFGLHLANYFWSGIAKVVLGRTRGHGSPTT